MSSPVLQCPICSQKFGVLPEQAGQAVQCPGCNQAVRVPSELAADVPPPPGPAPQQPTPSIEPEIFGCPICNGRFAITPEMHGQQVGCPHCQSPVLIQSTTISSPPIQETPSPDDSVSASVSTRDQDEEEVDESDLFAPGYKPKSGKNLDKKKQSSQPPTQPPQLAQELPTESAEDLSTAKTSAVPPVTTGLSQVVEPTVEETVPLAEPESELGTENIDHLLPPRFDVPDPERLPSRYRNGSEHKVILPDGKGGLRQVDDRIVTIIHKGEEINLISLPPEQLRRKRQIQNIIAIIIGAIVLAVVFALLRKSA